MSHARFQKQQREKARREKAAAKQDRRDLRREEKATTDGDAPALDQADVVAQLSALHARYDAGEIELDEFIEAREALTQQLTVD